jgi:hypothetical protein
MCWAIFLADLRWAGAAGGFTARHLHLPVGLGGPFMV